MTTTDQITTALSNMSMRERGALRKLSISRNPKFPFDELSWILPQMPKLKSVTLRFNRIKHLGNIFSENKKLKQIDLLGNDVTCAVEAFEYLRGTLSDRPKANPFKCKRINLSKNPKINNASGISVFNKVNFAQLLETLKDLAAANQDMCRKHGNAHNQVKSDIEWYIPAATLEKWGKIEN
jgi:Leucine-rich repeat (LRR) protein